MNAEFTLNGIQLETERLILRAFEHSDLDDFFEYASVDGVGQMAGWEPHKSKDESLEILNRFIEGKKTFAFFLIDKLHIFVFIVLIFNTPVINTKILNSGNTIIRNKNRKAKYIFSKRTIKIF